MTYSIQITIAFPVYNVEKYVEKSLRSALDQDFKLPYEILIINDKGQDSSMQIVQEVVSTHKRGGIVRIVEHEHNKGNGPAKNTAIQNAKGKYLFFLDSDDWISNDCLSTLYAIAEKNQCDCVYGSVEQVYEEGESFIRDAYQDIVIEHDAAGVFVYSNHIAKPHLELWNKLFRLDFLQDNKIHCIHRIMEDSIFDFHVCTLAHKIAFSSHITLYYYIRENSTMTKLWDKPGTDESAQIYSDIIIEMQKLIKERYSLVEGIYDLYYARVDACLCSLARSRYTAEQNQYIDAHVKGFNDFVPSIRHLHFWKYRIPYLCCKITQTRTVFVKTMNLIRKAYRLVKR